MYFDVIFLSLISFAKRKKNPDDAICGPQRIKLPPGSCYPPLANSSYQGGYCHPLVRSSSRSAHLFFFDLGPLQNTQKKYYNSLHCSQGQQGQVTRPWPILHTRGDIVTLFCALHEQFLLRFRPSTNSSNIKYQTKYCNIVQSFSHVTV